MDAHRFDSIARIVGAGATRRALVAAALAVAPAAVRDEPAGSKKKPCPPCKKRKKGKCKKKLPDGAPCRGGTCQGGACVSGGPCSASAGKAVSVVAATTYAGKSLQATQTMQPFGAAGQTSSQLDFTLGNSPLLTVKTTGNGGVVTVNFIYGDAFRGIRRAQFTNDGSTITGEIDGRAINAMPAGADPNSATFQDGGPPPNVQVDPKLQAAIASAWEQLEQAAANCNGAARGAKTRSRRSEGEGGDVHAEANPQQSVGCLALYIPCQTGYVGCLAGSAGCAALIFAAPICVAAVVLTCTYAAAVCRRVVRLGATCCPVKCGGNQDPANPFGDDPSCCEQGETCLDPNSNRSGCCPPGKSNCAGQCCTNGKCVNGFCCESPQFVCGNQCCGGFANCCGGQCCTGSCCGNSLCCPGVCNGGVCCNNGSFPCGSGCCPTDRACCNGVCCNAGASCINNQCVQVCSSNEFSCTPPGGTQRCCSNAQYTDCCSWGCGVNACTR